MKDKSKEQIAKICSLMERVENRTTLTEAVDREKNLITEALSKNRQQVTRDQIIDILNQADANPKNNGLFASMTYLKCGEVYKTKKRWRKDAMTKALDKYVDQKDTDWYKKLSAYNQDDAKGQNPVQGVVVTQRYVFHWQSQDNFDKSYSQYADKLQNLRMKYGISAYQGDNNNQRTMSDVGVQMNQTGKLSRDFNMAGVKPTVKVYLTDDNGHVISQFPEEVMNAMRKEPNNTPKPEKEASELLSGPVLDTYMKEREELSKTFKAKNFTFDNILCMAISVDGVSYYYINDAVSTPIVKDSETLVNAEDMVKIAEEQLGETFDAIKGFEY